jgi:hypothetical protein
MKTPNLDSLASKTSVETDDLIIPDFVKSLGSIPIFGEAKNKISSLLTINKELFYSKLQQENQIFSKLYVKEDEKSAFPLDIKEQLYDLYSNILKDLNINADIENILSVMGSETNKELLESITYLQDIIKQNVTIYNNNNAEKFKDIIELQNEENQALVSRLGQEGLNVLEKTQTPIVKRLIDENMKQDRLLLKETEEKLKNNEGLGWLLGLLGLFKEIKNQIPSNPKRPSKRGKLGDADEEKRRRGKLPNDEEEEKKGGRGKPGIGSKVLGIISKARIGLALGGMLTPTEIGVGEGEQTKEIPSPNVSPSEIRSSETLNKLYNKEQPTSTEQTKETSPSPNTFSSDTKSTETVKNLDNTKQQNTEQILETTSDKGLNNKKQKTSIEQIEEAPTSKVSIDEAKDILKKHNKKQKNQEESKQPESKEGKDNNQPKAPPVIIEKEVQNPLKSVLPNQEPKSEDVEKQSSQNSEAISNKTAQEQNIFTVNPSNNNNISNNTNSSDPLSISSYTSKLIQALR